MSEKSSLLSNCNPRKFFTIRLYVFSWVESNANRLYNVIKTFLIKSGQYKLLCRWKWNWNFKVSLEGSRKFYFLFHLKIAQPLDREEKPTFSGCRFKLLHGFTTRNHLSDLRFERIHHWKQILVMLLLKVKNGKDNFTSLLPFARRPTPWIVHSGDVRTVFSSGYGSIHLIHF